MDAGHPTFRNDITGHRIGTTMGTAITVSEFNRRVGSLIANESSLRDIVVVGELSSFKVHGSGHAYPVIEDAGSVLNCTFFRGRLAYLDFKPEIGMKVAVFGSANYYEKGGKLNFNIEKMVPFGEGDMKKALEELAAKLLAEGLFDAERKRPLPRYPITVGVVTSESGAAIRDIVETMAKRFPANLLLAPSLVQGDAAPASIVKGIESLNSAGVDVIIVGRGGGSSDDLSAFNDESVVRAIAASKAPVISAVGHATDKSLADRAADAYAETPTMAAVLATADLGETISAIDGLGLRASKSVSSHFTNVRSRLSRCDSALHPRRLTSDIGRKGDSFALLWSRADAALLGIMGRAESRFASADAKLDPRAAARMVRDHSITVDILSNKIDTATLDIIAAKKLRLEGPSAGLSNLDPYAVLKRGYGLLTDARGRAVTSVADLEVGGEISVVLRDGSALAEIKEKRERNDRGKETQGYDVRRKPYCS